jgi:hypothetical protein
MAANGLGGILHGDFLQRKFRDGLLFRMTAPAMLIEIFLVLFSSVPPHKY